MSSSDDGYLQGNLNLNGLSLFLQPGARQLVLLKEVLRLLPDFFVVVIDPFDLCLRQQGSFNQIATQGCHGNMFEAQPRLVTETVPRLHLASNNHVYKELVYSYR